MITSKVQATFVGKNGSFGYVKNKSYHLLLTQEQGDMGVSVHPRFAGEADKINPAPCNYASIGKFLNSWKDVSSEEYAEEEKELTIYNVATIIVNNLLKDKNADKPFKDQQIAFLISPLMNYIVTNNLMPSDKLAKKLSKIKEELYDDEDYQNLADAIKSVKRIIKNQII